MSDRAVSLRLSLLLVAVVVVAYFPALFGEFLYDDVRFVEENPAIHELSADAVVSYFTDPRTLSPYGWKGIYRPLRTLDFSLDWALAGGAPWLFHLKNILFHALGAVLLMHVLGLLLAGRERVRLEALAGAMFFALHPVHTECVAWITSRADTHVLVLFLAALLLHLKGRVLSAAVVLVAALLAKETAVMFAGAAFLADRLRGAPPRYRWYAVYLALAGAYTVLWYALVKTDSGIAQMEHWWGGSYIANLLTMARGFLLYLERLFLPVSLVIDYHVPVVTGFSVGLVVTLAVLAAVLVAAIRAGRRARFALLWFLVLIFPTSNLLVRIGIPTAERFLYLPSIGIALALAPVLARHRLSIVLLACFAALTFARTFDWRTEEALWTATERVATTPRSLAYRVEEGHRAVYEALFPEDGAPRDERLARARADAVSANADELLRLYAADLQRAPGNICAGVLSRQADALYLTGRPREALEAAGRAIESGDAVNSRLTAADALAALGRPAEAAEKLEEIREPLPGLGRKVAALWFRAGADLEMRGQKGRARECYRRSWEAHPHAIENAAADEALRRLLR